MKNNRASYAALGVMVLTGMVAATAAAEDEITECDVLVSHPLDPDRVTTGVPTSQVDHPRGIAACKAAVAADPNSARAHYQLGRVYFYDGQADKAIPHLEIAAAADHRQSLFVLGYLLASGEGGVETDICRTEDMWARSARAGRLAALVSYPHHVVRGRFDDCTLQVSTGEMMRFLDDARTFKLSYYQEVLVDDITEDLKAYMAAN